MKSLYSKLGLKCEDKEGCLFAEYVKEANDAKEEGEKKTTHIVTPQTSNQYTRACAQNKSFQQSRLLHMRIQEEVWAHLYR